MVRATNQLKRKDDNINNQNNKLKFESIVAPSNNHYLNYRSVPKGKKQIIMAYHSKEYKSFKKELEPYLKQIVEEHNWDITPTATKHYYLDIVMYFDRTDKDPNNYFKTPCDVGNEIIYVDDRTIITRVTRVYYTYNEQVPPHFEYELYPVEYIGIFDSVDEYEEFVMKCKSCRNYKDGDCKRLAEYMFYKITKDFDWENRECLGYKEKK